MPNNTHDVLAAVIAHTKCKPGWRFKLVESAADGLRLRIYVPCIDARDPEQNETAVHHFFPVPMATYNDKTWRRWVFECCRNVETHELGEFFMVGNERPFAPLHGPGENPYLVHEFRPETDARTTQDGTVTLP